jgi:hypothetical protein
MDNRQRKLLNKIFTQFEMDRNSHVAEENDFTIINRNGIMHLKYKMDLSIEYELVHTNGVNIAVIKASTLHNGMIKQTFGEVSPQNCDFGHPVNVAEKRAMSRLVLECAGLYDSEFLGEDEFHSNPIARNKPKKAKPAKAKQPPPKSKRPATKSKEQSQLALQSLMSKGKENKVGSNR